jgi:hypothetical protein
MVVSVEHINIQTETNYSLRSILLFVITEVSTTKMCLDTSILANSIMGRREYCDMVTGLGCIVSYLYACIVFI